MHPAQARPLLQIAVPWWNAAWASVRPITVSVGADPPLNRYAGYSARLSMDTSDASRFRPDCADVRIVYWNGSANVELDRDLYGCGGASTEVWFALQADIPDSGSDTDYFVYYGNPTAGAAPADRSQVYLWWDDFSLDPFAGGSPRYTRAKAVDIHGNAYSLPSYDAVNARVQFNTGDNFTSDFYVDNSAFSSSEQDVLVQVDHWADLNYPSNATDAIVARLNAINTSSTHEYLHFSHGTYNPSPACSVDSWTNGERNSLCGGISPAVYWAFNTIETWAWALSDSVHRFWRDPATTFASPDPSGRTQVLSGALSTPQAGYVGLAPAQSRGWWDNLLVRRYTEPEPAVSLGVEEAYAPLQFIDPKSDSLFLDADGNGLPSAGDTLAYTVQVTASGAFAADAVVFSDTPDSNTALVSGSVTSSRGTVTGGNGPGDSSVVVDIGLLPPGVTVTISFRVVIADPLPAGVDTISNQGQVTGANFNASLTDDPATVVADDPTVTRLERLADQLPATGFPPGRVTALGPGLRYQAVAGMQMRIPAIGLAAPVVGVPLSADGWDVSWLGRDIGYLEGTAFPTWSGNTGLTGHVTLADGSPGPLARLRDLRWGDEIVVEAWGQRYHYQVRSVEAVAPEDLSALGHEELDWITLLTCESFDPETSIYRARTAVRAVLIAVEPVLPPEPG